MDPLNCVTARFFEIVTGLLIDQESFSLRCLVIVSRFVIQLVFFFYMTDE